VLLENVVQNQEETFFFYITEQHSLCKVGLQLWPCRNVYFFKEYQSTRE